MPTGILPIGMWRPPAAGGIGVASCHAVRWRGGDRHGVGCMPTGILPRFGCMPTGILPVLLLADRHPATVWLHADRHPADRHVAASGRRCARRGILPRQRWAMRER